MVIFRPWSSAKRDDVRPDPKGFLPVGVLVLRAVGAHERVDERDAHRLGGGDDVLEVADHLGAMRRVGVERVRVVAQTRDGEPFRRDLVDDLARLARRQVGHVDVTGPGIAPGRARGTRPARDLEALETVGGRPVGDVQQRRLRERGGQKAESHRSVRPPCRRGSRSRTTSTQRPSRALSAIASLTSISSWPSANVG